MPKQRCPKCGSDVDEATWGAEKVVWTDAGGAMPPRSPEVFHPAQCTNPECDWEGPKDDEAVEQAKKAAMEGR